MEILQKYKGLNTRAWAGEGGDGVGVFDLRVIEVLCISAFLLWVYSPLYDVGNNG